MATCTCVAMLKRCRHVLHVSTCWTGLAHVDICATCVVCHVQHVNMSTYVQHVSNTCRQVQRVSTYKICCMSKHMFVYSTHVQHICGCPQMQMWMLMYMSMQMYLDVEDIDVDVDVDDAHVAFDVDVDVDLDVFHCVCRHLQIGIFRCRSAQELTNRTVIGREPLICSKMCFTKTELVQ